MVLEGYKCKFIPFIKSLTCLDTLTKRVNIDTMKYSTWNIAIQKTTTKKKKKKKKKKNKKEMIYIKIKENPPVINVSRVRRRLGSRKAT